MGKLLAMITGNPVTLLYIAAGIAVAAAAAGGSTAWTVQGWRLASAKAETVKQERDYAIRDRAAEEAYSARYAAAVGRVRAAEDKSQADVAAVSAKLTKEKQDVEKRAQKAIADLHTGALSVRVTLAPGSGAAGGGADGKACTGAGVGPATAPAGFLAADDAAFLINLASEADAVVAQLDACQLILVADREGQKK